MDRLNNVVFLKTVVDYNRIGENSAEVAFVGRSNVGKSSVLNAVCGNNKLAMISRTPGRTRAINVFSAGGLKRIVDLPGYGFASGPAKERGKWEGMIEGYLKTRQNLNTVYVIVDAFVGPTKLDAQMVFWMQANSIPYTIIANKTDKISSPEAESRRREVAAHLDRAPQNILWVSARTKKGIPELVLDVAKELKIIK